MLFAYAIIVTLILIVLVIIAGVALAGKLPGMNCSCSFSNPF